MLRSDELFFMRYGSTEMKREEKKKDLGDGNDD